MSIKKVVIDYFDPDPDGWGQFKVRSTLSLRGVVAIDAKDAREKIQKIVQLQTITSKRFSVTWVRDGNPEGYAVWK